MKKIFTLIAMCMMAVASQAAITVYVQADEAPYLWAWNTSGDIFKEIGWPGFQMTEKKTVQGTEFWCYTFDETITTINYLFNNGAGKQTKDISGVTTDRYFTYDGANTFVDVTEQYGGTVPDVEVNTLTLKGNHDGWANDIEFEVVEAGKSFRLTIDVTEYTIEENLWRFKIRPNAADWVGYSQVYDLEAETDPDGKSWLSQAPTDDNLMIDLEDEGLTSKVFTFNASWAGGKDASVGWTLTVDNGSVDGIKSVQNDNARHQCYNLAGQSVKANYRGIVVMNGKKMMVK